MTNEEIARIRAHRKSLMYDLHYLKEEYKRASEIYARKLEALIRATERVNEQLRRLNVELEADDDGDEW